MTITASPIKYRYLGNGVTATFSYPNRVYNESDLIVEILNRADSVLVETLTLVTDYSVTIAANGQATVLVTNAAKIPSVTQDIFIRLDLPLTQASELPTGTPFPAKTVENSVDKLTSIAQILTESTTRALTYSPQSSIVGAVIADPVDNATLAFDGTSGAIKVGATQAEISNAAANAAAASASAVSAAASAATIGGFDLTGTPAANDAILWDTGTSKFLRRTAAQLRDVVFTPIRVQDFRLTLTSNTPVTTTNVTAASTVYLTPYKGNGIALYNGTSWILRNSAQVSIALSGLTVARPYDVFAYDNAGTVTLELTAWTSGTARATALVYQDGVLVRSGATTRRYLGTFYTTGATTTEDSASNRYLWNYYNRVNRSMLRMEPTASWTYSTAAWRQANASTANQLNFVVGLVEDAFQASLTATAQNSTATSRTVFASIGLNTLASGNMTPAPSLVTNGANINMNSVQTVSSLPALGVNYLAWLEFGAGVDTQTWTSNTGYGLQATLLM